MNSSVTVNKIIPFSSVDGPGNRLSLFLQGCNINCLYCHNPETINLCNNCGKCIKNCPADALSFKNEKVVWDNNICTLCDNCIRCCPTDSSPRTQVMTVNNILAEIKKVRPFIQGVTVSGGECSLRGSFLKELFPEIRKLGLTTFIDTNGTIPIDKELIELTDQFMIDLKAWENEDYIKLTGSGSSQILVNIKTLGKIGKIFEVRTVIVPSCFDPVETVSSIASFISTIDPTIRYKLIKYRSLGVRKGLLLDKSPTNELMDSLKDIAERRSCKNVIIL